ncbi:MAG: ribbon-helix-helix protein, CopG family [Candidatus Lokiarchaeota archaeon]|nr:ribbon-helix-helix protein, CopG family [Candidatus Lokiarchaeota archaeon]MBD3200746.1 ribbon-helix-helix protein, CopG family [Candidatus Lokiarchaeota archaeon]
MKIVTVNVPESYIDAIEKLVGENGLYPSRSELIRCAVREFLMKELRIAKNMNMYESKSEMKDFDEKKFVKIPVDKMENDEPVREFKTYKIVKRLEY